MFGISPSNYEPMRTLTCLFPALAILLLVAPVGLAQTYEPERGSGERSAILDAVRAETRSQHDISGAITFFDVSIRAQGGWAFFVGDARRPNGAVIGHCDPDSDPEMRALLYRTGGRWRVIEAGACATDVWYLHWPATYGAPEEVVGLGMTQPFPRNTAVLSTDDGFLSLRDEPSVQSGERIARMPSGSRIRVLRCQSAPEEIGSTWGRWCNVEYGRQSGWAFSAYIDLF